jgi:N-acetylglucosaminyl-diphospho-decaprenol L-rhamnosyltransferase
MTGKVAVVIVNYRTPDMTLDCVAALAKECAALPNLRVIVVDGGSGDGSADKLRAGLAAYDWAELIACDFNGGFGWANNQGILHLLQGASPPDFIHLLNPDTLVEPGAVAALRDDLLAHPASAAVGSQLIEPDGSAVGSAFRFPSMAREFFRGGQMNRVGHALGMSEGILRPAEASPVDWVTGASVMLRADALRQVGLFDTGFFLYFEEVELMHRLTLAGWQVRFAPDSRVMHIGGAATGMADAELHKKASIPDYMFASRRRFFTLAYGPAGANRATRAWLAGNRVLRTMRMFGLMRSRPTADVERAGMLSHGIAASKFDQTPAVTRWDDAPGTLPAWHQSA